MKPVTLSVRAVDLRPLASFVFVLALIAVVTTACQERAKAPEVTPITDTAPLDGRSVRP